MKNFLPSIFLFIVFCLSCFSAFAQYCIPDYQNSCSGTGSNINKFTFSSLSNNTSGCNGNPQNYILYPASGNTTTSVELGGTYSFTIKSGSGSGNNQGFAIWIDFNDDQDFDDAGEYVYASPITGNILFSGTTSIPNKTNYIGQRQLRVRSADQSLIYSEDACKTFSNGETEDYTITIDPAPACTGTPDAGTLKAFPSAICTAGETVQLELHDYTVASGLEIIWEESKDGSDWDVIAGATNDVFITGPLDTNTIFRARITCINSANSDLSNEIMISVGNVKLGSVQNDSICGAGIASLYAEGVGGQIFWYDAPTGGLPVYNSPPPSTFTIDVDSTTTFYASASSGIVYVDSVGLLDSTDASGSDAFENGFLKFDVIHSCKLIGVYVYPGASGYIYLQLRDQFFSPIISDTFFIDGAQVNQRVFLELNFDLQNGSGYQLFLSDESIPLWSTQSGVSFPYNIPGVISITSSNLGSGYYFYFYNWIINYSQLCESFRLPVTAYVEVAPPISISASPSDAIICSNATDSVELTASSTYASYVWSPASGLSSAEGNLVSASPPVTTTYTVHATDSVCQNEASITVQVNSTPSISITATSDSICGGTSTQLTAAAVPLQNYSVVPIIFQPDTSQGIPVILDDDEVSDAFPVGFQFKFYGKEYSQFRISSNGFITFDSVSAEGCCFGQFLPNVSLPNNLIAYAWEDLAPDLGGKISFITKGIAPDRKLIVRFDSVPHYTTSGPDDWVISQIILYESSNNIEIHTTAMPGNPNGSWFFHTEGIENVNGTLAIAVPERNSSNTWTAYNDAWRFTPQEYTYNWLPDASLDDPSIANPVASPVSTTNYTVTVTDTATECFYSDNIKIRVITTPDPGIIDPAFVALCESDSVALSLSSFTSGATIQWQQSLTSGGPYADISGATQSSYHTPLLDTTTWFIAEVSCINPAATDESVVEVLEVPVAPTAQDVYHCSPGKVDLSATGSGGTLSWFDQQSGGNYLGSGEAITSPFINQSTTYWVEEGPPVTSPLSTTFIGGNDADGNMFDITGLTTITITGFDTHLDNVVADIEIYYRKGSYVGQEEDEDAWTLLGAANNVQGQGTGILTPVPVSLNVVIPEGKTYGFYITSKITAMKYSAGSAVGNVYASDAAIEIREGAALDYPFENFAAPQQWNGVVHYSVVGCYSERTPVNAIIYYPVIAAATSDSVVCGGDTISLFAINSGLGNFNYQWYPLLPVMFPPDGIGDTVLVVPVIPTTFTLIASEENNQCDTIIETDVQVNLSPDVSFSGLPDTMLITDSPVLLDGIPFGGTFTGAGIFNGTFFDPALAGMGGPYAISYSFTNGFGCSDDTTLYVVVEAGDAVIDPDNFISAKIYPNPSDGIFHVIIHHREIKGEILLNVYDVFGKEVFRKETETSTLAADEFIDASSWPKGTYLLRVLTENSFFSARIILQ